MPVSIAAIRGPSLRRRGRSTALAGVTSRARSRPAIGGSAAISSRACASAHAGREDAAAHRARVADVADERAGVDAGDRRDAAVAQPVQPAALGAGRVLAVDRLAHDRRARVDAVGLHRLGADAVVADVRVGEGDELAGEGRVGHRLLVAGHAGREDDLAGGVAVGAAGVAVEARAVLEQHVAGRAAHMISLWIGLELGRARPRRAARSSAVSTRRQRSRRRRSILLQPDARGRRACASATASAATWTSTPASSRSCTVWLTQTCASMPQTSAWSRPSRSKPSARAAEKTVFASRSHAVEVLGDLGHRVARGPRGYCSVTSTGTAEDRARPATRIAALARRRRRSRRPALRKRLLHVDHDERGALAVERRGAHAPCPGSGARHREGALAVGDGAGGDGQQRPGRAASRPAKQQFSERLS